MALRTKRFFNQDFAYLHIWQVLHFFHLLLHCWINLVLMHQGLSVIRVAREIVQISCVNISSLRLLRSFFQNEYIADVLHMPLCKTNPTEFMHATLFTANLKRKLMTETSKETSELTMFFSSVQKQFGQFFLGSVFVCDSSLPFLIQLRSVSHLAGSCHCSPHSKQNMCPHLHLTSWASLKRTFTAKLQLGDGHQRSSLLLWTKLFVINCWYFVRIWGSLSKFMTVTSSTRMSQLLEAQEIDSHTPSPMIFAFRYSSKQGLQKRWPHWSPVMLVCGYCRKQISQSEFVAFGNKLNYEIKNSADFAG